MRKQLSLGASDTLLTTELDRLHRILEHGSAAYSKRFHCTSFPATFISAKGRSNRKRQCCDKDEGPPGSSGAAHFAVTGVGMLISIPVERAASGAARQNVGEKVMP